MKINEVLTEETGLSFRVDNPGGEWLEDQRDDCSIMGKNQHGAPRRFGAVTGYFSRKVLLPVSILAGIKGVMGEQSNTREDSLQWLTLYMSKNNHLPIEHGIQYPPFITVDMDGTPWISEGNHRIKAASNLKWEYLPIEIRYYSGGEQTATALSPAKVKSYNAQAEANGYKVGNDFRGKLS